MLAVFHPWEERRNRIVAFSP